jgi:hypothetical protein
MSSAANEMSQGAECCLHKFPFELRRMIFTATAQNYFWEETDRDSPFIIHYPHEVQYPSKHFDLDKLLDPNGGASNREIKHGLTNLE